MVAKTTKSMLPLEQTSYSSGLSNYLPSTPVSKGQSRKKEKREQDKEGSHPLLSPKPTSWDNEHHETEAGQRLPRSLPSVPPLSESSTSWEEKTEEEVAKRPIPQKKRVSFFGKVKCHYIKSHKILSEKRKEKLWYSREETAKVRKDAIDTIRKLAQGTPLGMKETSRGLENKTPKEFRPRVQEIRDIVGFVLEEQSRFFTPGHLLLCGDELSDDEKESVGEEMDGAESTFTNDEYLAAVYRYYNKKHAAEAIRLAAIDANEVYGVYGIQ